MKGFTLIELLITLVIIGVVIAIGIPGYNRIRLEGEIDTMRTRAVQVQSAKFNFINTSGQATSTSEWSTAANDQGRYTLLLNFLPNNFPTTLEGATGALIPPPYSIDLGATTTAAVVLTGADATTIPLQKY